MTSIDGTHDHPLTAGFICSKVRHFADHVYGAERLLHPAVRVGVKGRGEFRRASWDEALDLVAQRMASARERSGGEAILPLCYGGSNGKLSQDGHDALLFRRLGATTLERKLCAAATGAASMGLYGKMAGVSLTDYEHAKLVVVWGANPAATGIHLVPILKRAQERGALLVVVDPLRTSMAKRADVHLALRPGTDLPLALALHRWLFANGRADAAFLAEHTTGAAELERRAAPWTPERAAEVCGIPAEAIEAFARTYADTRPAVVRCGWGLERNRNGGSAVAAVLALPAVAGHFGVRGGGMTMSNTGSWGIDAAAAVGAPPATTRTLNQNIVGRALLELDAPRIEVVFVYNHNPMATLPNQEAVRRGFEREDLFTVVFDQVMTDSALYADVLLPATTFLEHDDLSTSYGGFAIQDVLPVIDRVGESRSNAEVFGELCERLGLGQPGDPRTPAEHRARVLASAPGGSGLRSGLDDAGLSAPPFGANPIQFVDVFPRTPDRKIHLVPEELEGEASQGLYAFLADPATPTYPLALLSPSTSRTISSTLGQRHRAQEPLQMNPVDAHARGLSHGDRVRVFNELGEVVCLLETSEDVRREVVVLPKGLWSHNTLNGRTANALAPDTLSDVGKSACFNDARVQVARA